MPKPRLLLAGVLLAAATVPTTPATADVCVFVYVRALNLWAIVCSPTCTLEAPTRGPVDPICGRLPEVRCSGEVPRDPREATATPPECQVDGLPAPSGVPAAR